MTPKQIQNSLTTGELKTNLWDKISHFGIVIYSMMIPSTFLFFHAKSYLKNRSVTIEKGELYIIITTLIISILLYLHQKSRLKFKTIKTHLNRDELEEIIKLVASELKWDIHTNNDKIVIAKTSPGLLSGSWGEQITILFDNKRVLVNSICDPNKQASIVSMGRNKKNTDTLINYINKNNIT